METRNASPANTPHYKGIILCDTGALQFLMHKLPNSFLLPDAVYNDPRPCLFDGLIFLAKHGYKVIIPEAVAYEIGNHMRDGKSTRNYFSTLKSPKMEAVYQIISHRPFFREVSRLEQESVPISIEPPLANDTSESAKFLNSIYTIHSGFGHESAARQLNNLLTSHAYSAGSQFADEQIKHYLRATNDTAIPVYVLSNDSGLQHTFADLPNVSALGGTGFASALSAAQLFPHIGLNTKQKNTVEHLVGDANAVLASYGFSSTYHTSTTRADCKSGEDRGTNPKMIGSNQSAPFAKAMMALAQELKTQEHAAAEHTATAETPTLTVEGGTENITEKPIQKSRAEWFREKYGIK